MSGYWSKFLIGREVDDLDFKILSEGHFSTDAKESFEDVLDNQPKQLKLPQAKPANKPLQSWSNISILLVLSPTYNN